jgi:hypothetical protein
LITELEQKLAAHLPAGVWQGYDLELSRFTQNELQEYQALLEEIRSYPIAPINKAKISDFLWVVENDFSNAKIAETAYCEHLKNTGAFAYHGYKPDLVYL